MKSDTFIDVLLQAPGDIRAEYKDSKLPKFIKRILINRDIKKYYKSIDRLINEGAVITSSVLFQYLSLLENEFKPDAKYKDIVNIKLVNGEGYKYIIANIYYDDFNVDINSRDDDINFEIKISYYTDKNQFNISNYTFINNIMICKLSDYRDYIHKINETIVSNISSYFKEYIKQNLEDI